MLPSSPADLASLADFSAVAPEILLGLSACGVLLVDLFVKDPRRILTLALTLTAMLGVGLLCALRIPLDPAAPPLQAWAGLVRSDALGYMLKAMACLVSAVVLIYGHGYAKDRGMLKGGEWFSLTLFALLGSIIMMGANHLLIIYLGLELLTLSSYALVALRRDHTLSTEAAMKYFVLGALASGFLLYGMSLVYGATGSLALPQILKVIATGQLNQVLVLGLVFVVAGLAFKFGAAPFHMWIPDVYQGAPTAVTLLIGAAPKLAAFAIAFRLLVEGLLPLAFHWQQMLAVLAVLSLLVGNLGAIAQSNLKRMLAYSTIAQMGFVFLGLLAGTSAAHAQVQPQAWSSALFYTMTYVLTTLVSFGMILLLSRQDFESENIHDLAGLNQRNPFFAGIMLMAMFSLAGIPLFVGFFAKLYVIQSLLQAEGTEHMALAVFAVLMSLVAAFYYLRIIKIMYFDPPVQQAPISSSVGVRTLLGANGLLLMVLGIFPSGLLNLSIQTIQASMAG